MVVPEQLADAVRAEKSLLNNGNPWLEQATLADFMRSGSYAAHLLRVRSHYKESRDCLLAALRRNFGDVDVDGDPGGPACALASAAGRPRCGDARGAGAARAGRRLFAGLGPRPFPAAHRADQRARSCSVMPRCRRKQIEQGIARLSDAIDDAIDDPATDMTALFSRPVRRRIRCRSRASAIWLQDFGSNRLYADRRLVVHFRRQIIARQGGAPMPVLKNIYRYPIKGLSAHRFRLDLAGQEAVAARSDLRAGAAGRAVRSQPAEMGQEGPVRHADAGRGAGAGQDRARCRDAAVDDQAGQSPADRRRSRRRSRTRARSRNSSGSWFPRCAARRRWFARATGISWTSRTM